VTVTAAVTVDDRVQARRWAILAVLCLSLLVVGIDGRSSPASVSG
jgi:hypothetical protein